MTDTLRKPRLTDNLLEDLAVAAEILREEAAYLASAIDHHKATASLVDRFKTRRESVFRAEAWLTRHIEATRSQRGTGELALPLPDANG